jgi:hypothetical protein
LSQHLCDSSHAIDGFITFQVVSVSPGGDAPARAVEVAGVGQQQDHEVLGGEVRPEVTGPLGAADEFQEAPVRLGAAGFEFLGSTTGIRPAAGYLQGVLEHRYPLVPGKHFAGTVEALGEGFAVGDAVFGVVTKPFLGMGSLPE